MLSHVIISCWYIMYGPTSRCNTILQRLYLSYNERLALHKHKPAIGRNSAFHSPSANIPFVMATSSFVPELTRVAVTATSPTSLRMFTLILRGTPGRKLVGVTTTYELLTKQNIDWMMLMGIQNIDWRMFIEIQNIDWGMFIEIQNID